MLRVFPLSLLFIIHRKCCQGQQAECCRLVFSNAEATWKLQGLKVQVIAADVEELALAIALLGHFPRWRFGHCDSHCVLPRFRDFADNLGWWFQLRKLPLKSGHLSLQFQLHLKATMSLLSIQCKRLLTYRTTVHMKVQRLQLAGKRSTQLIFGFILLQSARNQSENLAT